VVLSPSVSLTVSGLLFQPSIRLNTITHWVPQIGVFNLHICLYCSQAGFIMLCTCSAPVLHGCQSVPAPLPLMFLKLLLEHFHLFSATPTPYPMHDDAHCWVMYINGRERERERERAGVAGLILTAAAHWRPSCQWISGYGESSLQPWRNQFTRPLHDDMYQTTSASIIVPRCLSICVLVSFFVKQPAAVQNLYGTKVCRYNWHSAGSLG